MLELDVAEARKLASQMRRARQLRMSFGDDAAGVRETPAEPVMLKVFIDQEVRTLLKLAARERRGRVVLDAADPTLTGLIAALEAHHTNELHAQTRIAYESKLKGDAADGHRGCLAVLLPFAR